MQAVKERKAQALLENAALNREAASGLLEPFNYAIAERTHRSTLRIGQPWAGGHQKVLANVPRRVDLDFDPVAEQAAGLASAWQLHAQSFH